MSRFGVNCNNVWREVSSAEFTNMAPSSEHDRESVRGLVNLIREALQVLQNPVHLSPTQISELKTKVRRLEAQLAKESTLAKRVTQRCLYIRVGDVSTGTNSGKNVSDEGSAIEITKGIGARELLCVWNIVFRS